MTNEGINKKMDFIVEQKAQFAADIQVMREVQALDAKLLKAHGRTLERLH